MHGALCDITVVFRVFELDHTTAVALVVLEVTHVHAVADDDNAAAVVLAVLELSVVLVLDLALSILRHEVNGTDAVQLAVRELSDAPSALLVDVHAFTLFLAMYPLCLLYTSDAADE